MNNAVFIIICKVNDIDGSMRLSDIITPQSTYYCTIMPLLVLNMCTQLHTIICTFLWIFSLQYMHRRVHCRRNGGE
ncbi:hypothetical protein Lalb_Chr13g0294251 [Lupinus albus]|uniref:Uncharacterized protein n=1 Tax=Lupinus albus TaxID=3870 RepID=A0A6A4PHX5_LUPAL|nr:hypothetical protein Lalb_Chr13g0294251 [Lupinus albus]